MGSYIYIYIYIYIYSECLTKEALNGLGGFNIGGQIIQTVKYADDFVLTAKEETVLQGMIDNLIETGRYYGMDMNVEKTKVMRISRQPSPVTITVDQKQLENVKCFKYLGSVLTDDGRCTCEIKSRIAMTKAAFNRKKNLFTRKLAIYMRKKLVKCYVWSMALYGAEYTIHISRNSVHTDRPNKMIVTFVSSCNKQLKYGCHKITPMMSICGVQRKSPP